MSAICSDAVRATPTMAEADVSDSPSFLNEPTSEFIVDAIAQDELLSLAFETRRPVEISFWTWPMPLLMFFSV